MVGLVKNKCFWDCNKHKNSEDSKYHLCCGFCNNKTCDSRCTDDPSKCKDLTDNNYIEELKNRGFKFKVNEDKTEKKTKKMSESTDKNTKNERPKK